MIVDTLCNSSLYIGIHKGFRKAFEFIEDYIKNPLPEGRYDIDGDNSYAMVQSYDAKPVEKKKWETHRNYIDLQCVIAGREIIYWTNAERLSVCSEYDSEKDFTLFSGEEGTAVKLDEGFFCVFYPKDAHKPGCLWSGPSNIKKIVIKIKY